MRPVADMPAAWVLAVALAAVGLGCDKADGPSILGQAGPKAQDDGARFTILLKVLANPATHAAEAQYYKSQTEQMTGWKGLYVVSEADHSELLWGRYPARDEAAKDLKKAKDYRTPVGVAVYTQAMIIPLPEHDSGPPEWDLRNAPGEYTVVVAVFYDVPEASYFGRKKNAVDYCRQLRTGGEQAYYHHGPARSTVTIGAFGASAVEMIRDGPSERPSIRDPGIPAIQARFPAVAVNGREERIWRRDEQTDRLALQPVRSYPARIPKQDAQRQADALDSLGNAQ